MPNRRTVWNLIKAVAALGVAGFLVAYAIENRDAFESLAGGGFVGLAAAFSLLLARLVLQTLFVPLLGAPLGLRIGLWESLGLGFAAASASNLLPLQAGLGLRAVYLKQRHDLPYRSSLLIAGVQQVTRIIACGVLGLGVLGALAALGRFDPLYVAIALVPLAAAAVPFWLSRMPTRLLGRLEKPVLTLKAGWEATAGDRPTLIKAVGLYLVIMTVDALMFIQIFHCMGHDVSVLIMAAYTQLKFIVNLVSVMPGNIGISEALTGFFANEMSIPFEQGVIAALVLRVVSTVLSAGGWLIALAFSFRMPRREPESEIDSGAPSKEPTLLYFGPSGIGDWCFIYPSLPSLMARFGCTRVHAVLPYSNEANRLLADNPVFAQVSYLDRKTGGPGLIGYGFRCLGLLLDLRRQRHRALAISYLSTQPDFLLLATLSGIPDRVAAFARPPSSMGRWAVTEQVQIDTNQGKIKAHGRYGKQTRSETPLPPMFGEEVLARGAGLRSRIAARGPYVVLGIGGGRDADYRFWPAESYAALIQTNPDVRFVLVGGGDVDRTQADKITARTNVAVENLVGKTDMAEALALVAGARAVIGNDSGLTNVAVVLEVPSLTLYGPTDPRVSGAAILGGDHLCAPTPEPCQPCFRDETGAAEARACTHRRCLARIDCGAASAWLRAR